jgi:hypothetical protein
MEKIWEDREDCRNGLIYWVNCIKKRFQVPETSFIAIEDRSEDKAFL